MARIRAVNMTLRRSSGTRHAFASQENNYLPLVTFGRRLIRRRLFDLLCLCGLLLGLRLFVAPAGTSRFPRSPLPWSAALALADTPLRDRLAANPRDRTARALDLLPRGGGEEVRRDDELLRQLTLAQDLDVDPRTADQAGLLERVRGDVAVQALEIAHVDRLRSRPVRADGHGVL